ncbi:Girdin [Amphibalanus amphitrite]|uniref:Girdin n=1 Tax=Amphibalanus amphitrite TaxID=1232801 RepID=A0A6A4WVE7_AMPAM|nr:Girdin [Amphibalanus amphitrite]
MHIRTFQDEGYPEVTYGALVDGLFLQDVMLQIYPDVPHREMTRSPGDASARIRNLSTVLKNIKHFYEGGVRAELRPHATDARRVRGRVPPWWATDPAITAIRRSSAAHE